MKSYCVFRDCEMLQIILSKSVSGTSRVAFFFKWEKPRYPHCIIKFPQRKRTPGSVHPRGHPGSCKIQSSLTQVLCLFTNASESPMGENLSISFLYYWPNYSCANTGTAGDQTESIFSFTSQPGVSERSLPLAKAADPEWWPCHRAANVTQDHELLRKAGTWQEAFYP